MTAEADPLTAAKEASAPGAGTVLVARMRAGERRAIAEAATECERAGIRPSPGLASLMRAMQPYLGRARLIGITGPPGAGKSTLVNALIDHLRALGLTVGVIAVDPSSPISGGAILGDRVRMTAALDDDGVFVRSVASRGALGGLSPAAVRVVDALDAAGFNVILIETVGTGQSEIDIAEVADVRIVVNAPGLGDDIQAMKSGLLEIADILVVNKGDRPDADATLAQLKSAAAIRSSRVPVLKCTAATGDGIKALWEATAPLAEAVLQVAPEIRRRRRARTLIARAAAEMLARRVRAGEVDRLGPLADDLLEGRLSLDEAARRLLEGT
ncbi:MAG: methylmalonyl Co-A mutase-associated GTPase MeaB [Hyphomicrobium sp.]|nr:methylmalonyl Co-A mutase-associated GTPase MeaB [Hyphomicrobium sp.]